MRKLILTLLLASVAATPALADPQTDREARQAAKAERQQAREERQQSRDNNRQANVERSAQLRQSLTPQAQQQPSRPQQQSFDRAQRIEQRQARQQMQADNRAERVQQQDAGKAARDAGRAARDAAREARQANRNQVIDQRIQQGRTQVVPQPGRVTRPTPVVSNTPRPGTQPPAPVTRRPSTAPNWSTNWRHNHRYDWQNWRRKHHSWFRLGFYYDPFGWGYSPYSIGWRMWPAYYGNRFWINDPWYYRLPYAPPGYRWVRYYNDAILVDTWSGEVVDVIYNFFW
jgi:Ni/Co efflux regulator RcnB